MGVSDNWGCPFWGPLKGILFCLGYHRGTPYCGKCPTNTETNLYTLNLTVGSCAVNMWNMYVACGVHALLQDSVVASLVANAETEEDAPRVTY